MSIRRGRPADIGPLADARQTVSEATPDLLAKALTGDGPFFAFVATTASESGATPVGYVVWLPGPDSLYIPEIAVQTTHQREGYGAALLSRVVEYARKRDSATIRLTVAVTNTGARQFYRAHGFRTVERLPGRFESDDGLLLARNL